MANSIEDYHTELSNMDERVRRVLIALDDEYTTGRIGTRELYAGELEMLLYLQATSIDDFIMMLEQALPNEYRVERRANEMWNQFGQMIRITSMVFGSDQSAKDLINKYVEEQLQGRL